MRIISESVKETLAIGTAIGRLLRGTEIILLQGGLGSGKTVLAKGIARGLGIKKESVSSPTFVLLRVYVAKVPLYHFDLYRLKTTEDILSLGYHEYFYAQAAVVIEWPERLKYLLPKDFLKINLSLAGKQKRKLRFTAAGEKYKKILTVINENIRH